MALSPSLLALVEETIDRRALSTVFQPLVYAHTSEVVGFEALARGPAGSPLEPPLALMAAASEAGRLEELDWACAAAAASAALGARLHPSMTVFVNLEPSTLATECPPDLFPTIAKARENLRVVVEMGERSLLEDPSGLLDAVELVRKDDWGVAVDRVGGDRAALVMLPIMKPDVIKVSLPLLKSKPAEDWAETATVVRAYTERTGAVALAQGVEGEGDVLVARSLGASYLQGWHYGRPGPLPAGARGPRQPFPLLQGPGPPAGVTPFELVAERRDPEVTERSVLVRMSRYLEDQALREAPVAVLTCLEGRTGLRGAALGRYGRLASAAVFTALLGREVTAGTVPAGVRAVTLHPSDDLAHEWDVLVIGPHFAAALVARRYWDGSAGPSEHFEYVVTHDRELVVPAARALLHWVHGRSRIGGQPPDRPGPPPRPG